MYALIAEWTHCGVSHTLQYLSAMKQEETPDAHKNIFESRKYYADQESMLILLYMKFKKPQK